MSLIRIAPTPNEDAEIQVQTCCGKLALEGDITPSILSTFDHLVALVPTKGNIHVYDP